jgi:FtsH-binding integral membrane protein
MNSDMYSAMNIRVADASADLRVAFVRRTYLHLAGAIFAFIVLEAALFQTAIPETFVGLLGTSRYAWLIVMGAFMGISYLAENWANSDTSEQMQYAGLALYVAGEALIFVPLLYLAVNVAGPDVLLTAALMTLLLFAGLTYTAVTTKKDFYFLGSVLKVGGFIALGAIACSVLFGFTLGLMFSAAMVLFAAASVLYNTSNILHRYNPSQHVAASLALFASIALLFWYVLRIVMGLSRRN